MSSAILALLDSGADRRDEVGFDIGLCFGAGN